MMSFKEYSQHKEILEYLKNNGLFESLWVFPSGGKIPKGIPHHRFPEIVDEKNLCRKQEGLKPNKYFSWADYTKLMVYYPDIQEYVKNAISNPENTISLKLGPVHPAADKYLFSIDLDCKEGWKDNISRQKTLDAIVNITFNAFGKTLVTGSRGGGRHIIYLTDIPQTTVITNSTSNMKGLHLASSIDRLFSVDYVTSPSWDNSRHTTIYGHTKDNRLFFGILENYPIKLVNNLTTGKFLQLMLDSGMVKDNKELRNQRNRTQDITTKLTKESRL